MKLGQELETTISDEEILERILAAWIDQVQQGGRPGEDLYQMVVSEALKSFVKEGRESARLMFSRFQEKNDFATTWPILKAHTIELLGPDAIPEPTATTAAQNDAATEHASESMPEETPEEIEPVRVTVDQSAAKLRLAEARENRQRNLRILFLLLLILGGITAINSLDRTIIAVNWDDIPPMISVYAGGEDIDKVNLHVLHALYPELEWGPQAIGLDEIKGVRILRMASATQSCATLLKDTDILAPQSDQIISAAGVLGVTSIGTLEGKLENAMVLRYPSALYVAQAPAAINNSKGVFELAVSAVPGGLSGTAILVAQFVPEDSLETYTPVQQVLQQSLSGTTLLCREPTLWGWWFDRSRYIDNGA